MIFYKNSRVIFPDKVRDKVIAVDNGKIADICDNFDPNENDTVIDCHGLYLSPGFVDIHVHGGGKKSAMSENPQDIIEMAQGGATDANMLLESAEQKIYEIRQGRSLWASLPLYCGPGWRTLGPSVPTWADGAIRGCTEGRLGGPGACRGAVV